MPHMQSESHAGKAAVRYRFLAWFGNPLLDHVWLEQKLKQRVAHVRV